MASACCSTTRPNILHYGSANEGVEMREGMIFTIEPMINLGRPHVKVLSDGWTAVTRDRSLSAQYEHTVGVTKRRLRSLHAVAGRARPSGPSRLTAFAQGDLVGDDTDERGFFGELPAAMAGKRVAQTSSSKTRSRITWAIATACAIASGNAGATALPDYELLELLLFRLIPRRDTKPCRQGADCPLRLSGRGAGRAGSTCCAEVKGVGEAVALDLKVVAAVAQRMARGEIKGREVLSSWSSVLDYCRAAMAFEEREQFRILFLDKKNALIADEVQQTGTVDHTPVYPREVIRRALELSATAHHPGPQPPIRRSDAVARRHRDDEDDRRRRPSRSASPSTTTSSSARKGMPA